MPFWKILEFGHLGMELDRFGACQAPKSPLFAAISPVEAPKRFLLQKESLSERKLWPPLELCQVMAGLGLSDQKRAQISHSADGGVNFDPPMIFCACPMQNAPAASEMPPDDFRTKQKALPSKRVLGA
jgi:hypothetical protein